MAIMALGRIRLTALVPLLLSLTAFILSMLCIFAGSKTGYLESANLLTVSSPRRLIASQVVADIVNSLIPLCLVNQPPAPQSLRRPRRP